MQNKRFNRKTMCCNFPAIPSTISSAIRSLHRILQCLHQTNIARPFPATVANTFSAIPCSNIPVQKLSQHATIQPLKRHSQMSKHSISANKTNNRCDAERNLHVFGKHRRSQKQCGMTSQGRSQALPNQLARLSRMSNLGTSTRSSKSGGEWLQ